MFCRYNQCIREYLCTYSFSMHAVISVYSISIGAAHNLSLISPNKNTIKRWAKDSNRLFSKETIQMANKHVKKCLTSLVIRGIQIKTSMRYHFAPTGMARIKKLDINKCWQRHGEFGTLEHCC